MTWNHTYVLLQCWLKNLVLNKYEFFLTFHWGIKKKKQSFNLGMIYVYCNDGLRIWYFGFIGKED